MLGKLIKYDMKALNRFLLILHGFLLLISVLGRVFVTNHIELASKASIDQNSTTLALTFIVFFILVMGVSFGTNVVIAIRFYKNVYSDEGYLTRTLPVTSGNVLLSKTITGSIWRCIDTLLLFVSMYIVAATPSVTAAFIENKASFMEEFGITGSFSFPSFIVGVILISCIGCISSVIMYYTAIALGQLFSSHRIVGAVVCYFAISTVISIFSTLTMAVTGLFKYTTNEMASDSFSVYAYMQQTFILSIVICAVFSIVLYIITYILMKKKTNLV